MTTEQIAFLWLSLSIGLSSAVDICEYQMNGVRLAHPADCNKFVECQNGKTYRISNCPLGLHFNRFKGVCDLRQRAACELEFMNFANEEMNCSACCVKFGCYVNPDCPDTPGTTTTPGSTTTVTTFTASTTVSPATRSTTLATSTPVLTTTTTKPITPTTSDMPTSTVAPITQSTPTPTTSSNTPPSPETPSTASTPVWPITPGTNHTNQCPNDLTACHGESDHTVMHVNGTCSQFITCLGGCAFIITCPGNLQYDIAQQKCDYPENVHCPWQSTPPIAGPSGVTCANHGKCAGQRDGKLFADPNSDGYIICQCECEVERPCPKGTQFSETQLTCVWKENLINRDENLSAVGFKITCDNEQEICREQKEGAIFPVNGACNKFYKCNFGCAVETLCPGTLIYNPLVEQCDYPENYKCPWPNTSLLRNHQDNEA